MNAPTKDVAAEHEPAWDVALLFPPQGIARSHVLPACAVPVDDLPFA